jgi:small subunit ribosomal protein S8
LRYNSIDILKCLVKKITDVDNKKDKIEIQSALYPIMPNLNIYKDPITNMFIGICNASYNFKESIIIHSSNFKIAILKILKEENYISSYTITKEYISIFLKYELANKQLINNFYRISNVHHRIYINLKNLEKLHNSNKISGIMILTTSKGVLTSIQCIKNRIGGEIIVYII